MSRRKKGRNPAQWVVPAVAVLLLAVWLPSILQAGHLPQAGQSIQDFTATTTTGERFKLSQAYTSGEVVLVFYRGHG